MRAVWLFLVVAAAIVFAVGVWRVIATDGRRIAPTPSVVETGHGAEGSRAIAPAAPAAPARPVPGGRVALVIGNGGYKAAPLSNPENDATDIAAALRGFGFKVIQRGNLNQRAMRDAIREFGRELQGANVGLFYFAGHGLQVRGENYLVPVNEDIGSEADTEDLAIRMDYALRTLEESQVKVSIVILDACRNNPFARSFRSASRGLAQMQAASGSLIAFATAPGSVAADGSGRNGIYTKHLLASLQHPDTDILKVFQRAAADVHQETGGKQTPWVSTSLIGDFRFGSPSGPALIASVPPPPPAAAVDPDANERLFWESMKDSRNKTEFEAYLTEYPNGRFAPLARARLNELEALPKPPADAPSTPAPPVQAPRPPASPGTANAEQSYRAAVEAHQRRDYAGAVGFYRQAAEQGHARAQIALGGIYLRGAPGIAANPPESVRWFRHAAERGDPRAQNALGQIYWRGASGVPKDEQAALKLFRNAAAKGYADARYTLGLLYLRGEGVPQDHAEAFGLLRKAAEQNHPAAQTAVAEIYAKGAPGIPKDDAAAVRWYRSAAERGYAGAQYAMGLRHLRGQGVPKDDATALNWFRQAAERGHAQAQVALGDLYAKGGRGVPKDEAEAMRWYRKAAAQGNADAQQIVSRLGAR